MKRWIIVLFYLSTGLVASGGVTPEDKEGYYSVHYTNTNLSTILNDFADTVGINVSYNTADADYDNCNVRINNCPWQQSFFVITEPYGLSIHQIHGQKEITWSGSDDSKFITKDKPFYLRPVDLEWVAVGAEDENESLLQLLIRLIERFKGWSIALIPAIFIVGIFIGALPNVWAAKTLRIKDASIGKGMRLAAVSCIIGLFLNFDSEITNALIALAVSPILVMHFFQVSLRQSIGILFLATFYYLLLSLVFFAIAVGLAFGFGFFTSWDISL